MMNKLEILEKYKDNEEKLFVAKILDKIRLSKTRNKIVSTDFLDMHQKKLCEEILNIVKERNYKFYIPCEELEKYMLIIYPDKYDDIFIYNRFDYSKIVSLIRITLPNELIGKYSHKDYLGGIMKLGIKREKIGDILVFDDGADIVINKEISEYVLENLAQLTRFSKASLEEVDILKIRKPKVKKEEIRITVTSLRLDNIVSEIIRKSRKETSQIILNQRVLVNYYVETKNSKIINEKDVIVIRGKGKYIIKDILGETKKGKIAIIVEHYI